MDPVEHFLQCRFCMSLNPVYISTSVQSSSRSNHPQSDGNSNSMPTDLAGSEERYDVDDAAAAVNDYDSNYDTDGDDINPELNELLIKSNTLSYSYVRVRRPEERIKGDAGEHSTLRALLDTCSICLAAYETSCEVRSVLVVSLCFYQLKYNALF